MHRFARYLAPLPALAVSLAVAQPAQADVVQPDPVVSVGATCTTAAVPYGSLATLTDGVRAASATDSAWLELWNGASFQLSCHLPAVQHISSMEIRFSAAPGRALPSRVMMVARANEKSPWSNVALVMRPTVSGGVATFAASADLTAGEVGFLIVSPDYVWSDELTVRGRPTT